MGIFSRSSRGRAESETANDSSTTDAAAAADDGTSSDTGIPADAAQTAAAAPQVGISVSTFQGVGSAPASNAGRPGLAASTPDAALPSEPEASVPPARPRPPAEAPASEERLPGVRDNALLRAALATLTADPSPQEILEVARQLLQGHVFLRVKGDARSLLSAGKELPLLVASQGDQQYLMVYSGGEALQAGVRADGDTATSAMGQPVSAVLRHVLANPFAGIVLDQSSAPARLVLPRDLLEKAAKDTSPDLTVKTLLAGPRTEATAAEIVAALPDVPLWIAANKGADGQVGIAEAHTADGTRYLELFSHPLEVFALGRKDQPIPVTVAQLAKALAGDEGISGVLLDPAGPWLQISRADLAPVLALS